MKKLFLLVLLTASFAVSAQVKSDTEMGTYNNTYIRAGLVNGVRAADHNTLNKYILASKIHKDSISNVRVLPGDTCIEIRYKTTLDTLCVQSRGEMVRYLDDLLDVDLTDVDSQDILRFDDESNLWKNVPMPEFAAVEDSSKWRVDPVGSDTIRTSYNVVVDSSFKMNNNGAYLGYDVLNYGQNSVYSGYKNADTTAWATSIFAPDPNSYSYNIEVGHPNSLAAISSSYASDGDSPVISMSISKSLTQGSNLNMYENCLTAQADSVQISGDIVNVIDSSFIIKEGNEDTILYIRTDNYATRDATLNIDNFTINGDITYGDTYWRDATVAGLSLAGGVQAPTLTEILSTGIFANGFNYQTANDIAYGSVQLNHDYKLETDIEAHAHWSINTSPASGSDTVVVRLTYAWADVNEAIPTATSVTVKIPTYSASGGGYHRLTELEDAITGNGGDGLSSVLFFKIERLQNSASDTYANWWLLHDIDFHYQIDAPGSDDELVK